MGTSHIYYIHIYICKKKSVGNGEKSCREKPAVIFLYNAGQRLIMKIKIKKAITRFEVV